MQIGRTRADTVERWGVELARRPRVAIDIFMSDVGKWAYSDASAHVVQKDNTRKIQRWVSAARVGEARTRVAVRASRVFEHLSTAGSKCRIDSRRHGQWDRQVGVCRKCIEQRALRGRIESASLLDINRVPIVLYFGSIRGAKEEPCANHATCIAGCIARPLLEPPGHGIATTFHVACRARDPMVGRDGEIGTVRRIEQLLA